RGDPEFRLRKEGVLNARGWEELCRQADQLLFRSFTRNHQGGCVMAQTTMNGVVNGVDVGRLGNTIQAVTGNPGLAKFQFRAVNRWNNGSQNRTTLTEFYGAGQENPRRREFTLDADEPEVLLGRDAAPNPVEYVLTALAGCLTTAL